MRGQTRKGYNFADKDPITVSSLETLFTSATTWNHRTEDGSTGRRARIRTKCKPSCTRADKDVFDDRYHLRGFYLPPTFLSLLWPFLVSKYMLAVAFFLTSIVATTALGDVGSSAIGPIAGQPRSSHRNPKFCA